MTGYNNCNNNTNNTDPTRSRNIISCNTIVAIKEDSKLKIFLKEKGKRFLKFLPYFLGMYISFFVLYAGASAFNRFFLKSRIKPFSKEFEILGHAIKWPGSRDNPLPGFILFEAMILGCVISYLIYSWYLRNKAKKEGVKLETPTSWKMAGGAIIILGIHVIIFLKDETDMAINKSLTGSFGWYFTLAFGILIMTGIIGNLIGVVKLNTIGGMCPSREEDQEKEDNEGNKEDSSKSSEGRISKLGKSIWKDFWRFRTLPFVGALTLATVLTMAFSFGINLISPHDKAFAKWSWSPITIGEDQISLLSNKGNMLVLGVGGIVIFALLFKFAIPFINSKWGNKKEEHKAKKDLSKVSVGSTLIFIAKALGIGLLGNILVSLTNSLEKVTSLNSLFVIVALMALFTIVNTISEILVYIPNNTLAKTSVQESAKLQEQEESSTLK